MGEETQAPNVGLRGRVLVEGERGLKPFFIPPYLGLLGLLAVSTIS